MNKRIAKKRQSIYRVKTSSAEILTSTGCVPEQAVVINKFSLVRALGDERTLNGKSLIKVKPYRKKTRKFFRVGWIDLSCLEKVFEN